MALLTEERVRQLSDGGRRGPVVVNKGDVLTPAARSWLREHRVETVFPQGEGDAPPPSAPIGQARPRYETPFGAVLEEKPEHMTHLRGNVLVMKDHPRIAFRGEIDLLEAEILLAQQASQGEGMDELTAALEQVLAFVRRCIRFDVLEEPVGEVQLCGLGPDELRAHSHYPEKYENQPHFLPHYSDGPTLLAVNKVRAAARRCELAAYRAFRNEDGGVRREDLILALNRLSSLLWILMIRIKAGRYGKRGI